MFRSKEGLEGVPGDSTDIFQRKMLDEYLDRPDATFKSVNLHILILLFCRVFILLL